MTKKKTNPVHTKSGMLLAITYIRIVRGERGDYIEIAPHQMVSSNIHKPKGTKWRKDYDMAYYEEYRTNDSSNTMIYYQKRLVNYADYKIGMYYVSVNDVVNNHIGLNKFF